MAVSTEQQFLEMSQHFKVIVETKNKEIVRLKKFVALIYGLVRTTDEHEDMALLEIIRTYTSDELNTIMGIDSEDD